MAAFRGKRLASTAPAPYRRARAPHQPQPRRHHWRQRLAGRRGAPAPGPGAEALPGLRAAGGGVLEPQEGHRGALILPGGSTVNVGSLMHNLRYLSFRSAMMK